MRGRMVTWTVAVLLAALAGTAGAAREQEIDRAALKKQATQNKELAAYLRHNGYPDMAEVRPITDEPPWDDHEVILYYLGTRKEISFARARVLGRPDVSSTRYERVLTDADIRALRTHAAKEDGGSEVASACTGNAVARAECAAGRAENAADRVDVAATRAEKAADKTEAIVEKMAARGAHARRRR